MTYHGGRRVQGVGTEPMRAAVVVLPIGAGGHAGLATPYLADSPALMVLTQRR